MTMRLPPKSTDPDIARHTAWPSEDVLVWVKGSGRWQNGRYLHRFNEWQVDSYFGYLPEVLGWSEYPPAMEETDES